MEKNKSATNPITCGRVNPDIFFIRWRKMHVQAQRGGRTEQISRHYLALRRMLWRHFSAEEPWVLEWIRTWYHRIRVDGKIFESGKKKLRIQKYPDTCGRGLSVYMRWGYGNIKKVLCLNLNFIECFSNTSANLKRLSCVYILSSKHLLISERARSISRILRNPGKHTYGVSEVSLTSLFHLQCYKAHWLCW